MNHEDVNVDSDYDLSGLHDGLSDSLPALVEDPPAVRHDHQQLGRGHGDDGEDDGDEGSDDDGDDDGGDTCDTARLLAAWFLWRVKSPVPRERRETMEVCCCSKVNWPPTLLPAAWLHCWPSE